uniref:Uncharacterized protein n=1 Tax=Aegilops tauschii subsp. strangulata TaxID=200361 RepID=A0A453DIN3_AEGTS
MQLLNEFLMNSKTLEAERMLSTLMAGMAWGHLPSCEPWPSGWHQRNKQGPPGLEFEQVIHIDSSKWESRRAVQREISEQLKLPGWVRKMFDKQDEDDDFSGMDQGSRTEIAEVTAEIHRSMQSRRFLLVLHNGSSEEIDTFNLGLSLYGYLSSKMLWTFQGRFRLDPKLRDKVVAKNTTDVLLSASRSKRDPQDLWSYLLLEEAKDVSCKHGLDPATVAECYSYMLERSYMSQNIIDYEWTLHASKWH